MNEIWQNHLRRAASSRPEGSTLAAFNINVDVVASVTPENIEAMVHHTPDMNWDEVAKIDATDLRSLNTKEEFAAVLRFGFSTGKSALLVRDHEDFLPWWQQLFPKRAESMGGQAGIIANQMAALGARSIVYSPMLSPKQAAFCLPEVLWPVVDEKDRLEEGNLRFVQAQKAGRPGDLTREPWVFEFRKEETFHFPDGPITTPRANRAIITTGIQGPERRFHNDIHSALPELGAQIDVAFMAGYHQCGDHPEDPEAVRAYIDRSISDLAALRSKNPAMKVHVEYVPAKVREMERELYEKLSQQIDSFGINETETRAVLRRFGHDDLASQLEEKESAYLLYKAGAAFLRDLNVERVHIHNLGYYVVVLAKPYGKTAREVRDACLFASAVNVRKAMAGGYVMIEDVPKAAELPLSDIGFNQLEAFAAQAFGDTDSEEARLFMAEGIFETPDHTVIVTPAHVAPNPVVTVGMGDTISSSSYLYEVCPKIT